MAITEKITNTTVPTFWEGEIPVRYVYTFGHAGERFFRAVKDKGTFLATRCEDCDITYMPPKIYCDRCMEQIDEYFDAGTTGYVETFTISFRDMGGKEKEPRVLAMIRIDGTDGGLIHYLQDVDWEEITIGMPVKAVFRAKSQRKGGIEDITGFKPVK